MASNLPSKPPSYDEEPTAASAQISVEPPTYDDVADSQPRDLLTTDELPCLAMDGCLVYAESQPANPLYELSNPPTVGKSGPYAVEKFIYRLSTHDGEGAVRKRKRHLYDFSAEPSTEALKEVVAVEAKASSKLTFNGVKFQSTVGSAWTNCKAEPHFKVAQRSRVLGGKKGEFEWKDWEGDLVAVETKVVRKSDNTVERPPRLEVKSVIGTRELDLLVAVWGARVWKETLKETAEPFSWAKFKRISQMKQGPSSGRLSYGFAHR